MPDTMELSASLEDYIEAILNIIERDRVARVKAIAAAMGVSSPSVTGALKALSARGLVNYDPYAWVTLTREGHDAARKVARRHAAIAAFLGDILGLREKVSQEVACQLEHAMPAEVMARLHKFVEFVEQSPLAGEKFLKAFLEYVGGEGGIKKGPAARDASSDGRGA